jgi:3-methyladenine DNA glycosylase Mpg
MPKYLPCVSPKVTLAAIDGLPALPHDVFARPAEVVAPDLIGCLLVQRQPDGELLWGVILETEVYFQQEPTNLLGLYQSAHIMIFACISHHSASYSLVYRSHVASASNPLTATEVTPSFWLQ